MASFAIDCLFKSALAGVMMRYICALLVFLWAITSFAQANYSLLSLYEQDAYVTERFIPFSLRDNSGNALKVENVIAFYPCFSMVDPHREHIFHLFCVEEVMSNFNIVFWQDNALKTIAGPSIDVKKVAIISSTPKPKQPGEDPVLKEGQQIFTAKCASCHPGQPISKGQTAASIENSFATSPDTKMKSYVGFFTKSQREALAKYINEGL